MIRGQGSGTGRGWVGALLLVAALLGACAEAQEPFRARSLPPVAAEDSGPLRYLGGLHITGGPGFGGWSGLHLAPDLTVHGVADVGTWFRFRLLRDGAGAPRGIADPAEGRLGDGSGAALTGRMASDAESLARLPDGTWLIGFERWHRIRQYRRLDGPGLYVAGPPGVEQAPYNGGLESLAVLSDGRLLAITEYLRAPGPTRAMRGWLRTGTRWTEFAWPVEEPWAPVDAAGLPEGGALVLERRFSFVGGFGSRIRRLHADRPGAPEPVAGVDPPLPAENYEGIAAARVGTETLVALVSDDNQTSFQRTLLLLFRWAP